MSVSSSRRDAILSALRKGTVPSEGLDQLAVGLDHLRPAIEDELGAVAAGSGAFKAIRGEYGSGKTFASRWIEQIALDEGFAVAEIQISENETPLHKLETVYRRATEQLRTSSYPNQAFRSVLDSWLGQVELDAMSSGRDPGEVMEERLAVVGQAAPVFPLALRGYRSAVEADDVAVADGLAAWLGGQPSVAATVKRYAGVKSDLDHFTAMGFFRGLLEILRGSGHAGLLLVLDEVETLQRMRADTREKALNSLRQWIDELDNGRYPGMYLLITGTTAFFEGAQGVKRLPPLDSRINVNFSGDPKWDNPRLPQIRLQSFDLPKLVEVGIKVRDLYAQDKPRVLQLVDDTYVSDFAVVVAGSLGAQIGIDPRSFLRQLVDVLDRTADNFPNFDPRQHYVFAVPVDTESSISKSPVVDPDDIEI